ncbi:hypothetical protein C2845_PM12G12300 [Panicum miliaceum]|uniref:Uncharacterized protein n=1 Tax=Panicum miliaceum TaxID=4540 RepID=A0A3L6QD86_PANMI|nr:hypothetical protein C2845_PM12G12300 [Panicum miliaceum]
MSVRDVFLHSVKRELNSAPVGGGKAREIHWDGNIFLTDLLDRKITDKIKLSNFHTKSTNILRLHDEKGGFVSTFENMWDLTPQTDLVQELPAEYSTESALVDLTDNALQAVWSNGRGERKLIKGTMGSSNHRVFRQKGIGGKAPYSLPFFGMFGYGGTIASMHLGSTSGLQTAGGVRDPSKEEMLLSPHQSFTQVEICGLKKHLEVDRLGFLKDIYFPYIQYDEETESMNTRNPVEFEVTGGREVNGVNLAEVQEGEVTVTNLHSSNGPDFIVHLKFTEITAVCFHVVFLASCQAHARLKCVYFPVTKGPLPFMEAKYRKGHKAEFFRRCCKRSCRDTTVIQKQTTITVCPDLNSRRCLFSIAGSSTDSAPVNIRLGCPVRCLAVKSVDQYGNEIPFLDTSGVTITIFDGDDVLAHVDDVEVELSSDSLTMNVKDFLFKTSKLDILQPKYEAKLKLSSFDSEFSGIWPCKVKRGLPSTIIMDMSLFLEENLTPGRVIDSFLLEMTSKGPA